MQGKNCRIKESSALGCNVSADVSVQGSDNQSYRSDPCTASCCEAAGTDYIKGERTSSGEEKGSPNLQSSGCIPGKDAAIRGGY